RCGADHVNVLGRMRRGPAPRELARVVKTNYSRWVRERWSSDSGWQTGYGVFSVSESNVAAVMKYIASQEEHFAPSGACVVSALYPRLAPWAAFFRRFAALQFHANLYARPASDLFPRNQRAALQR